MLKKAIYLLIFSIILVYFANDPIIIHPKNSEDSPSLPPNVVRRALVVGGGLAGLSAALELADRGYNVTIKERDDTVGGKLATRPFEALGQTFYVEHGFHAWFHNYFQFKDIRERLNINKNFRKWEAVDFFFRKYKPESVYSNGPYPFNLLGVMFRSQNLRLVDAFKSSLAFYDLMFYDHAITFQKYDNISFDEWAKASNVSEPFYEIMLKPALSVTLNEGDVFSAGEMLMFQQIYFLASAESDRREVTNINYYHAVLKPWVDYLENKGVRIIYNNGVKSLKIDPKTNLAYGTIDENGDDTINYDHVIMAADFGPVKSIFENTYENYKSEKNVSNSIDICNENYFNKLKIAPDYKVFRGWFDKQLNSAPEILETPDYSPINLIAQYHLLEEEFITWAKSTGGSVMEFHLYTFSKLFPKDTPDEQVWDLISPTVKLIYPEIFERDFKLLAYHVNSYENFASYEKGLNAFRPSVNSISEKCLIPNVYIAGDWIKTSYPAALMERAVSTGREAANEALIRDHVRQAPLKVLSNKGPGIL